jgi:transcriptional regulator with XRE-family HTH domain
MRTTRLVDFGNRVSARLVEQRKTLHALADEIGMSYEMTRRYARGFALPPDPAGMERLAKALECSVGWLLADEAFARLPPLVETRELKAPIKEPCRWIIEDDAMLIRIDGYKLFGIGDEAVLYPRKPLAGDTVALRIAERITLRRLVETDEGVRYTPRESVHSTLKDGKVIGVVAGSYAKMERL